MSGIFGVFSKKRYKNVFSSLYSGLFALQHRGQESMGMSLLEYGKLSQIKGRGVITDNIKYDNIKELQGSVGLGHVRYPFESETKELLPMPWLFNPGDGSKKTLIAVDGKFFNDVDVEDVVEMINSGTDEELIDYVNNLDGAYSIIFIQEEKMVVIRDPKGIKSITVGHGCDFVAASSESCGLDAVGASSKELRPGEIFIVEKDRERSIFAEEKSNTPCIFEYVYTARPDSVIGGVSVYDARIKMGEILYEECPVKADVVIGSPDSGLISALGFSRASGIMYERAIVRNRYIGRTFILPTDNMRRKGIQIKLQPIKSIIKGKDIVLVDDSIVRGNTMRRVVEILRESGANSIHIRISSPPVIKSENTTFDIPSEDKLIAKGKTVEEIRKLIGCDSLGFISLEGLRRACGGREYYERCFGGNDTLGESDVN